MGPDPDCVPFTVRFYSIALDLFMYVVPPSIDQTLGGSASYLKKHQKHFERTMSYAER